MVWASGENEKKLFVKVGSAVMVWVCAENGRGAFGEEDNQI